MITVVTLETSAASTKIVYFVPFRNNLFVEPILYEYGLVPGHKLRSFAEARPASTPEATEAYRRIGEYQMGRLSEAPGIDLQGDADNMPPLPQVILDLVTFFKEVKYAA